MNTESITLIVLWVHAVSTWYMIGLIWFVQVVHYPLKSSVGESTFQGYQRLHVERTGWVVGPPMLLEAGSAAWLVAAPPEGISHGLALIGVTLLGVVWLATAAWSVPAHGRLADGFDQAVHRRLVRTNWIRTLGWSARGVVAIALIIGQTGTA